jgi:hypothetical protein
MTTRPWVTIVSGLPRSGTSMMMRMLEAGGLPVLTDHLRQADEDNPNGYYEFEAVKRTAQDAGWLAQAQGHAVKMVYRLLYDLPREYSYRVVFMRRDLAECIASQDVMIRRQGKAVADLAPERLSAMFASQLEQAERWLAAQPNMHTLYVNYNDLLAAPLLKLAEVSGFLDDSLDVQAMAAVVDPALYRQRRSISASAHDL